MPATTADETTTTDTPADAHHATLHHHDDTPLGTALFLDRHQLESLGIDTTADAIAYRVDGGQLLIDDKS